MLLLIYEKRIQTYNCNSFIDKLSFCVCPRYRRKIFNIPNVEDRFKALTTLECQHLGIDILAMECHADHVHLFISCLPTQSPADIMKNVKGTTSHALKDEFPELTNMPSLWTRSYFVSTAGNVSSETIKWYVDTQKKQGVNYCT